MDSISFSKGLPLPGDTVMGNDFQMTVVGRGANQAAAYALIGIFKAVETVSEKDTFIKNRSIRGVHCGI